ncbi:MAG TPA: ABC transporter ATP-binding protein [Microlunatus sp.]
MPLIAADGVSHTYGAQRRPVLHDVTVELFEHRIGVIGANGSGKSTFARLLNGLILPDRGTVTVDGHDTRRDGKRVRQLVGFCFTDPDAQIVMPTVAEDVAFSLRRRDLRGRALEGRVAEVLDRFGLAGHADHPAQLLSGGQKQLLALASVLVTEPALVVLDEPTTLLDLRNATLIADLLAGLEEQIVLLTHHLDLLSDYDRVLVFDEGRLVADAPPAEAVGHYQALMRSDR